MLKNMDLGNTLSSFIAEQFKLATSALVSASPTGDTKQLETRQKNLQQLVSKNKKKENSSYLISKSVDNSSGLIKVH